MKRISIVISIVVGLTLASLIYARSQKPRPITEPDQSPTPTQAAQIARDTSITPVVRNEYLQLLKSHSSKAAVGDWARRHKLGIVRLKEYDILVPEQQPTSEQPEAVGACDAKKCPTAVGDYPVHNTLGDRVGYQFVECTAGSCKWIYNKDIKSWTRICGDWKCHDLGQLSPG